MKFILKKLNLYNILCVIFFKKRKFFFEPFIYIDNLGNFCKTGITSRVKWLDKIIIIDYNYDLAEKKAFKKLNDKYPYYKNHIWIF